MPPKGQEKQSWVLYENEVKDNEDIYDVVPPSADDRKLDIVWRNVIIFIFLHTGGVYGAYLFFGQIKLLTFIFTVFLINFSGLGITAGAHRLWAHKSYKARLPLRILLTICNTIAFQDSVIDWARDHRLHHKYSETDADPHNATRGFFFSHIGWLMVRKHPQIKAKGHTINMSDLNADPVLRFQKKYYKILMPLACFIIPTYIPTLWGETVWNAFFVPAIFRYVYSLNMTWLVNSAAHLWGSRPYDKNINPADTLPVSFVALGEGYHNYHHVFPWDYKTAELGNYSLNYTKCFIDNMAKIGWAYDLKTVPTHVIQKRIMRTGDGSHSVLSWNDKDVTLDDKHETHIVNPEKSE
ncbi:acyl-CoA Delta-9 desaturase-like [Achroia grisella]|uniref:acyl-CoA Delta-9 desaturase-like n=1 Tax=Achroia grisella TaxID=688607 RepID=UPI0027D334B7|nr:acyl-CoA Delta-9 desaturase-like [Achroia grisella]